MKCRYFVPCCNKLPEEAKLKYFAGKLQSQSQHCVGVGCLLHPRGTFWWSVRVQIEKCASHITPSPFGKHCAPVPMRKGLRIADFAVLRNTLNALCSKSSLHAKHVRLGVFGFAASTKDFSTPSLANGLVLRDANHATPHHDDCNNTKEGTNLHSESTTYVHIAVCLCHNLDSCENGATPCSHPTITFRQ